MDNEGKKICKINDARLAEYVKRTRNGRIQVFYTGNDSRDFDRYKADGGGRKSNVQMHDKPDTINLEPPKKHYYSELINGEWWWMNGCAECNGNPRDWATYIECDEHNVCRTCKCSYEDLKDVPWGGKHGWQCKPCADSETAELKAERLQVVAEKEYDEWDYRNTDKVVCPHCESSWEPDGESPEGEQVCGVCDGKYSVEQEHTVTYSTEVVGERLLAE